MRHRTVQKQRWSIVLLLDIHVYTEGCSANLQIAYDVLRAYGVEVPPIHRHTVLLFLCELPMKKG